MIETPLKVHICWSRQSTAASSEAVPLFQFLHRAPDNDSVLRPGLDIPVELGRDLADLLAAIGAQTEPPV